MSCWVRRVLQLKSYVMTMQEANLTIFCHDALFAYHDKDVRTFAAFPLYILEDVELRVWLVGPWGNCGN